MKFIIEQFIDGLVERTIVESTWDAIEELTDDLIEELIEEYKDVAIEGVTGKVIDDLIDDLIEELTEEDVEGSDTPFLRNAHGCKIGEEYPDSSSLATAHLSELGNILEVVEGYSDSSSLTSAHVFEIGEEDNDFEDLNQGLLRCPSIHWRNRRAGQFRPPYLDDIHLYFNRMEKKDPFFYKK